MEVKTISLTVNNRPYTFTVGNNFGDVKPEETLLDTLRERLYLTGAKKACDGGACGCCTVIKDGVAVASCMTLTVACDGSSITTVEGLADPRTGELDPVQDAFVKEQAFQCGYCTPGIIMASRALLDKNPHPTHEEIGDALSGNFCRCISQYHVFMAVERVANMKEEA
ncbi:MAG: (2Fe-2S)-binding protein [Lachnospiraceae bacterium]